MTRDHIEAIARSWMEELGCDDEGPCADCSYARRHRELDDIGGFEEQDCYFGEADCFHHDLFDIFVSLLEAL